jgi:hypothetical protein
MAIHDQALRWRTPRQQLHHDHLSVDDSGCRINHGIFSNGNDWYVAITDIISYSNVYPIYSCIHPKYIPNASQMHPKCIPNASQMHPKCIPNASQMHPKCIPNDITNKSQVHPKWHPKCIPNASQMHPKLLCLENIEKTKNFASPETSQNHVQNFGTDFGADIGQQVGQTFAASCGQTLFSIWGITCIIRLEKKTWTSAEFLLGSPSQSHAPMHQASAASSQPTSQPV